MKPADNLFDKHHGIENTQPTGRFERASRQLVRHLGKVGLDIAHFCCGANL
jgi:hypothetical protein